MSFKSGCVHDAIATTEKETALAMLESIKANSGLFVNDTQEGYVAPHFCEYKPIINGLMPSFTKLSKPITSFKAGGYRHYKGRCIHCNKTKLVSEGIG